LSDDNDSSEVRPLPDPATIFEPARSEFRQRVLTGLFVGAFAILIPWLWGSGSFHDSREYWRVSWRIWLGVAAAIAVVFYPLFSKSQTAATGEVERPSTFAAGVASAAAAFGLTLIYAAATPHVMHRFTREPVQVDTTILGRGISGGKGGDCRYLDTPVSRQYVTVLFCVNRSIYDDAHPGQRIRIDGFQSWYGLEFKGYAILDR
jgi:hypothetical protein